MKIDKSLRILTGEPSNNIACANADGTQTLYPNCANEHPRRVAQGSQDISTQGGMSPELESGFFVFPWERERLERLKGGGNIGNRPSLTEIAEHRVCDDDRNLKSSVLDDDEEDTLQVNVEETLVKSARQAIRQLESSVMIEDEEDTIQVFDSTNPVEQLGGDSGPQFSAISISDDQQTAQYDVEESAGWSTRGELSSEGWSFVDAEEADVKEFELTTIAKVANEFERAWRGDSGIRCTCAHSGEELGTLRFFSAKVPRNDFSAEQEAGIAEYLAEMKFYLKNNQYREALELTLRTLQAQPDNSIALQKLNCLEKYARGKCAHYPLPKDVKKMDEEVDRLLVENVCTDPKLVKSLGMRPDSLTLKKRNSSSEKSSAPALSPAEITRHRKQGVVYWQKGNTDAAIREFILASDSEKHWVFCHTMLGVCYAEKNRVMDAIRHFKLGLHSENISRREQIALYFKLGRSYEYLKIRSEALYYYAKVVRQCPDYRDVKRRISVLKSQKSQVLDA